MDTNMYELWDAMVEMGIATSEEIGLVTAINGTNIHSLEMILYVRTGYSTLEQLREEGE